MQSDYSIASCMTNTLFPETNLPKFTVLARVHKVSVTKEIHRPPAMANSYLGNKSILTMSKLCLCSCRIAIICTRKLINAFISMRGREDYSHAIVHDLAIFLCVVS